MSGEFSVVQFFDDGSYEYVRHHVDIPEAMEAVRAYTRNVAASLGLTQRVIVVDGGDSICFEWTYGKGVTFPVGDVEEPE